MTDIDEAPAPVLPRELTEISDAVRAVAAPPTPTLAAPHALRLADPDADAELMSEWMNHRIHRYLSAQLDGEYSRPFICSLRGTPFAYVELYRAAKDSIAPRYDADRYDIGLHGTIASPLPGGPPGVRKRRLCFSWRTRDGQSTHGVYAVNRSR